MLNLYASNFNPNKDQLTPEDNVNQNKTIDYHLSGIVYNTPKNHSLIGRLLT